MAGTKGSTKEESDLLERMFDAWNGDGTALVFELAINYTQRYPDNYWGWVPGHSWGPGWVEWRGGGDYVGWRPLPAQGGRSRPPSRRAGRRGSPRPSRSASALPASRSQAGTGAGSRPSRGCARSKPQPGTRPFRPLASRAGAAPPPRPTRGAAPPLPSYAPSSRLGTRLGDPTRLRGRP